MWDSTPWFIGGGAEHSPEVARLLAYAATSGAEGIISPGDLKVATLAVPGSSIRVLAGACLIRARAAGGAQQTYVGRNPSEDVKAIAATGSGSGRTDMIVAQIKDPFMPGEPWTDPADVKVGPYIFSEVISNVPASATTSPTAASAYLTSRGLSAIPLAAVVLPANTGTVTAGMIKDLRALAQPRRELDVFRFQPTTDYTIPDTNFGHWPVWEPQFVVPEWATHYTAVMTMSSIYKPLGGHIIGDFILEFCVPGQGGTNQSGNTVFEIEAATTPSRQSFTVSGEGTVPAGYNGQTRTIRIGARRNDVFSQGTRANGSLLVANKASNFVLLLEFEQRAV